MHNNFRKNVGIVILNNENQVLIAKRSSKTSIPQDDFWQFPQGGIKANESLIDALYREIKEELNLDPDDFKILSETSNWLYYKKKFKKSNVEYAGQKQKWFLVRLVHNDLKKISDYLKNGTNHEFSEFKFVPYWFPISWVIDFKKDIYRKVLSFFINI